ncbi:MAG TPA: GTPase [Micromonospora sp.]
MTGIVDKVRDARDGERQVDVDALLSRVRALEHFLRAVDQHLPEQQLVPARTLVERASARLALSRDHTVVALAGSTGSGKSSLFNALARLEVSRVGVRRPTTAATHACVWGPPETAAGLLDWLGVLPRHRFVRESPLDGDDEAPLRGLVLLDLPDFDSVEQAHRHEVNRLLGLVDLVIWVLDPQKYADRVVHDGYLRHFHRHRDVTVVVLNQIDRLPDADLPYVLDHLRQLLEADGLDGARLIAASATDLRGTAELRALLERTVAERQAALRRLAGDVDAVVDRLSEFIGPPVAEDWIDRATIARLSDALATAAGVPVLAEATERAYRTRAAATTGWPILRALRRLRPDPLRRFRRAQQAEATTDPAPADPAAESTPTPADATPVPTAAQPSAVSLAVRIVADRGAEPLPAAWPHAVTTAARSRLDELSDALDRAVATTDLGLGHKPAWWRLIGALQWLVTLTALTGLSWLVTGYTLRALDLRELTYPMVGTVPVPTILLVGGLLLGPLLALLVHPFIRHAARRTRRRAEARLRAAVDELGREHVVAPVRAVLRAYAEARDALTAARADGEPQP